MIIVLGGARLFIAYSSFRAVGIVWYQFNNVLWMMFAGLLITFSIFNLESKGEKFIKYLFVGVLVLYISTLTNYVFHVEEVTVRTYDYITMIGIASLIIGRFLPKTDFEIRPKIKITSVVIMIIAAIMAFWQSPVAMVELVFVNYASLILVAVSDLDYVPVEAPERTTYSLNNNTERM